MCCCAVAVDFGDGFRVSERAAAQMGWSSLPSLNDESAVDVISSAQSIDSDDSTNFFFDSWKFNWQHVYDWQEGGDEEEGAGAGDADELREKCTPVIPGLDHKLCVSLSRGDIGLRFEAASQSEISDLIEDFYGADFDDLDQYDEYRYDDYGDEEYQYGYGGDYEDDTEDEEEQHWRRRELGSYDDDGYYESEQEVDEETLDEEYEYGEDVYDDGFDALYDAMAEYMEYAGNYMDRMVASHQALGTELSAMGQVSFMRDDHWDSVAIVSNAASAVEDDDIYYDEYYHDDDGQHEYEYDIRRRTMADDKGSKTEENKEGAKAAAKPAAKPAEKTKKSPPKGVQKVAVQYSEKEPSKPRRLAPRRPRRKGRSRGLKSKLTRAALFGEVDGEKRVLDGLRKAEMTSEAIGGGAIPGGGPPGFGYNGGKHSGISTVGANGLLQGLQHRVRGMRLRPLRDRLAPPLPLPHFDDNDFMEPPPPPLLSKRSRKLKTPTVRVKHYHYDMGSPRRRRRRRPKALRVNHFHYLRGRGGRRRRVSRSSGLVKSLLGNMGRARKGRRRRSRLLSRRRRGRGRRRRRRRRKRRIPRRRRRRKRRRSRRRKFRAAEEMQNMMDMDTIRAVGGDAMAAALDVMKSAEFGLDQSAQVRKCKMLSVAETCVTVDPHRGHVMLEVAVGSAKSKGDAASVIDDWNELEYESYDDYEEEDEERFFVEDEWFDAEQQTQWLITDVVADEEYDSLWADDANWDAVDQVDSTFSGRSVQRKCLHMWGQRLCLCQFLGWMDSRKFQCQAKGAMFDYPPMVSQKEVDRMAPPHVDKEKKTVQAVKPKMTKKKLEHLVNKALDHAVKKEQKEAEIKVHRQKKRDLLVPKHLPYRFSKIQVPGQRPKWLPQWMWDEFLLQNEQHQKEKEMHRMVEHQMKEKIDAQRQRERKEIKQAAKVLDRAKKESKKELKKEITKQIEKEKLKAAQKTADKAAKAMETDFADDFDDEDYGAGDDGGYFDNDDYYEYGSDDHNDEHYYSGDDRYGDDDDYLAAYDAYEEAKSAVDALYYELGQHDDDHYYQDSIAEGEYAVEEKDHWHDMDEDTEWIVSSLTTSDLDKIWDDANQWDSADTIRTESGKLVERKCLAMWKHRLCLCQFLDWIDSAKYKCYPRGQDASIMPASPNPLHPALLHRLMRQKLLRRSSTGHTVPFSQRGPPVGTSLGPRLEPHSDGRKKGVSEVSSTPLLEKLMDDVARLKRMDEEKEESREADAREVMGSRYQYDDEVYDYDKAAMSESGMPKSIQNARGDEEALGKIENMLSRLLNSRKMSLNKNAGKLKRARVESPSEDSAERDMRALHRHSMRLWRRRQYGMQPGRGGKGGPHGLGGKLHGLFKGINAEKNAWFNNKRDYYQGREDLPRFGDHPGHSDVTGHGFDGDVPTVPLHWHLAGVHAPNIGPQQHLVMSQPAHPDYPKKSYYMVITGYPKYGLPANRPHWIPSYMWSQMQALQHRGINVANQLDEDNVLEGDQGAAAMTADYDDYDYYVQRGGGMDDEDEWDTVDAEGLIADEWLDTDTGEQWVMMQDDEALDDSIVSQEEWANDAMWDEVESVITFNGQKVQKKCMVVFGRQLCLCQFMEWLEYGTMTKQCGPKSEQVLAKSPKDKPKWMPPHFWNYLKTAEQPHKRPSDINRRKWKLYLKFKKKGYRAEEAMFGDELLYDDGALYDDDQSSMVRDGFAQQYYGGYNDDFAYGYFDEDENENHGDGYYDEFEDAYAEAMDSYLDLDLDLDLDEVEYEYDDDILDALLADDTFQGEEELLDQLLAKYEDSNQYDEAMAEFYNLYGDEDETESAAASKVSDWWVDDGDAAEWIVTDEAMEGYDSRWSSDSEWENVSKRIKTKFGHTLTRKCLHMWGQRLCFCQFLDWIDDQKYKCMPRGDTVAAAMDDGSMYGGYYDQGMVWFGVVWCGVRGGAVLSVSVMSDCERLGSL